MVDKGKVKTFYEFLNIENLSDPDTVKEAFNESKKLLQSDQATYFLMSRAEKKQIMEQVTLAYEVLSDPQCRYYYDKYLVWEKRAFVKVENKPSRKIGSRESPGRILKSRRESMGYTFDDVHRFTKIAVDTIRAIEDEKYQQLPEEIYMKGLLKNYISLLKLPEQVFEEYMKKYRAHRSKS